LKEKIKITECPRDAMQGIIEFIPTKIKADYINSIIACGFDTIDFGSFVSPKAIPQLKDTAEVLSLLNLSNSKSKLLSIVGNLRGAETAVQFDEIQYIGFPFSISETFLKRNINSDINDAYNRVIEIQELCTKHNKELVVYISMAFGNPYNDEWNSDIACFWTEKLASNEIKTIMLADTIGVSEPKNITYLFSNLIPEFPDIEIGAHLHTTPDKWKEKTEAAYNSGCRKFDGAIKGFGGCPMAQDKLTGNMPTEKMIEYFVSRKIELPVNNNAFIYAQSLATEIFLKYH
jgi:hydroxymethylglutaryl-CoA lyase